MQDKIELYKDIVLSDPFSRVFYPLSIALKEQNNLEEAAHYLEQGLVYHTNFLEARMLFVDILDTLGDTAKRDAQIDVIVALFKKYPRFWEIWAKKEGNENQDITLALQFVAQAFINESLTLHKVFAYGLETLSSSKSSQESTSSISSPVGETQQEACIPENITPVETSSSENVLLSSDVEETHVDNEEVGTIDADIHTRSMADLLAEQGELEKALIIYKELLEQEKDVEVIAELRFIIQEFETRLKEEGVPVEQVEQKCSSNKENLINTLATLVSRLDARAEAIQTRA